MVSGASTAVVLNDGRGVSVVDVGSGTSKVRTAGDPVVSAAIDDTRHLLYAGTERSVHAYDIGGGSSRWDVPARAQSVIATSAGALVIDGGNGRDRADLRLLSPDKGKEEWRQSIAASAHLTAAGDGRAIVGDDRRVDVLDLEKGSVTGSLGTRSAYGVLTRVGGRAIFVSSRFEGEEGPGEISAIDLAKPGSVLWSERTSGAGCLSVARTGTVVGSGDGDRVRLMLLSHTKGQRVWELTARTDNGQFSCAVASGTVAVDDGRDLVGYR